MTSPHRRNSGVWIPVSKSLLIIAGALSLSLRLLSPAVAFAVDELPSAVFIISSLFKPPYIYLLLNLIILSIFASSRFSCFSDSGSSYLHRSLKSDIQSVAAEITETTERDEGKVVVAEITQRKRDSSDSPLDSFIPEENSLVSSGIGGRQIEITPPEGGEEETMEGRWKKIMEEEEERRKKGVVKMELGGIKMWGVPSLSQDEINSKADAFIKKINTQIRLQRDESLDQCNHIIGF